MRQDSRIQLYDFRHPRKLSKEQRNALSIVNEAYAKLLGAYFTTLLRTLTDVSLNKIDEEMFGEFISTRSEPACLCVFGTNKSEQAALFELQPELVFLMIDRLFGGTGKRVNINRANTTIEKNIIMRVLERVLQMWDRAWHNMIDIESIVRSYETNPYMAQIVARSEATILITFDVTVQKDKYQLNMCLPITMMMPFFNAITEWSVSNRTKEAAAFQREQVQETVLRTQFPFVVNLGNASLTMKELLELQTGDILLLDQWTKKPLNIIVDDRVKFLGAPGIVNRRKSVKITRVIEK